MNKFWYIYSQWTPTSKHDTNSYSSPCNIWSVRKIGFEKNSSVHSSIHSAVSKRTTTWISIKFKMFHSSIPLTRNNVCKLGGSCLDILKAFDTVHHSWWMQKMYDFGVTGGIHPWIHNSCKNVFSAIVVKTRLIFNSRMSIVNHLVAAVLNLSSRISQQVEC